MKKKRAVRCARAFFVERGMVKKSQLLRGKGRITMLNTGTVINTYVSAAVARRAALPQLRSCIEVFTCNKRYADGAYQFGGFRGFPRAAFWKYVVLLGILEAQCDVSKLSPRS